MKSVSSLSGVYNTLISDLEEKPRELENLKRQMKKASEIKPEATSHIEK